MPYPAAESETGLEEPAAQRRELVEHHEACAYALLPRLIEVLGQSATDLVEDQTDQRLGAADVRSAGSPDRPTAAGCPRPDQRSASRSEK
jgi:hypothetical protein